MHEVMKHLTMNIALPAERLQHAVNVYFRSMDRWESHLCLLLCAYVVTVVYYLRSVEPTVHCEQ